MTFYRAIANANTPDASKEEKIDPDTDSIKKRLQRLKKGAYILTIRKFIADFGNLNGMDTKEFEYPELILVTMLQMMDIVQHLYLSMGVSPEEIIESSSRYNDFLVFVAQEFEAFFPEEA